MTTNLYPIVSGLPVADEAFIAHLKAGSFDEDILLVLDTYSNDMIQKLLIKEIRRLRGFPDPSIDNIG